MKQVVYVEQDIQGQWYLSWSSAGFRLPLLSHYSMTQGNIRECLRDAGYTGEIRWASR